MFVLLIVVFGLGFVLFGVGSSGLGLGDIFSGIRGSGGNPSVDKPLKATQKNPKDAQAWKDLATAYDAKGDYTVRDRRLAAVHAAAPEGRRRAERARPGLRQQLQTQAIEAQAAQVEAQNAQSTNFGPPPTSPLGRALGEPARPDRAGRRASAANARFNDRVTARQQTATELVDAYQKLAKLQPTEPASSSSSPSAAKDAGDAADGDRRLQAVRQARARRRSAPQAKARLKPLQGAVAARPRRPGLDSRADGDNSISASAGGDRVNFDIKTEQLDGDGYVISLTGEVDLYTAPEFKAQLLDVIGKGAKQVIVDFTDTTFIDSTTLGVLVGGVKRLRTSDGELSLVCSDRNITKIFEITGLDRVFTIYPTRAEALQQVGASSPS